MKYLWIGAHCTSKKGVEKDYKDEWEVTRYMLKGKMFAMVGERGSDKSKIITLKLDPVFGVAMREKYGESVQAGYYMNKTHWNSIDLEGDLPEDILKSMIDQSYMLILQSLTKKMQIEISNPTPKF